MLRLEVVVWKNKHFEGRKIKWKNKYWKREWQHAPVFLPGKYYGRGAWMARVHRSQKSQTWLRDWVYITPPHHTHISNTIEHGLFLDSRFKADYKILSYLLMCSLYIWPDWNQFAYLDVSLFKMFQISATTPCNHNHDLFISSSTTYLTQCKGTGTQ